MPRKGEIAALLIGKAKKGDDGMGAGSPSCQAIIDAVKGDDSGALDAALHDWMADYEAEQGGGSDDGAQGTEG